MNCKRKITKHISILTILILLTFLPFSCNKSPEGPEITERGDIFQSTYYLTYTPSDIESILNAYGINLTIDLLYPVEVIKMVYYTLDPHGTLDKASGALMIPQQTGDLPVISLHHGTETHRTHVASVSPISTGEGVAGLVAASMGFAVFLPDYLGLGESDILHPYLHAKSSADACIDLLRAGYSFCLDNSVILNGDLYLGGYSEGGYVTLAVQKEIEQYFSFDFQIIACAPQAGPYDLYETVNYFISLDEYPEPTFLAYFITAYNYVYGWNRLDEIFYEPYAGKMEELFDGNHTSQEIKSQLPTTISSLIKENFRNGYLNGTETGFIDAVKENTLLDWTPKAPIRFYHSNADEVVPYQNSLTALQNLKANGGSQIELVTIEGKGHSEASIIAVPMMIEWFDSLRASR